MREQDYLSSDQSYKDLKKVDLKTSRDNCTLNRFIFLLCGLMGVAMLVEEYLHLGIMRQSFSILLIASEIFAMNWMYFTKNKVIPSLSYLYSNIYLDALLIFHLHTICGFSWNAFAYMALAAFIFLVLIRKTIPPLTFVQLSIVIIFLALTITITLNSERTIDISWNTIMILPTILLTIFVIWFFWMTLEEIKRHFQLIKLPIFQIIISYVTINLPICAYFIVVVPLLVSGQAHCAIAKSYTIISFILFAFGAFYKEEFAVLQCKIPDHVYRCSHTTFDHNDHDEDIKRRNKARWDIQDCVLCRKQSANVWFSTCRCLPYCKDCYSKISKKLYKNCPICQRTFCGWSSLIELEAWQWEGYQLKFHINSKINPNQHLIKRTLDR